MALRHSAPQLLLQLAAWAQSFITWYGFQQGGAVGEACNKVGFLKASLNITVNTFMLLFKTMVYKMVVLELILKNLSTSL